MIPKFRAWDKKNEATLHKVRISTYIDETMVEIASQWHWVERPFSDVILMQSIGLVDVNGVEIYEGDIVKVTDDYGSTDFLDGGIGTICGLDVLYMWYIDGQVHNGLFDINGQYYIEVIGNVHENPELLEVAE